MNHTRLLLPAVSIAAAALLAACGSDSGGSGNQVAADCKPAHADVKTVNPGTLTVSVYVSEPYTKLDRPGGQLGGVDGEIVARIAALECLTLNASPVAPAAAISGVQSNRADLAIGGIYYTEERAAILALSDVMYRDGMSVLSKTGIASLGDMQGKSVGVVQGYLWNAELQGALGQDQVKIYQDSTSMISDLNSGRVDAGVLTTAEAAFRAQGDLKAVAFAPDPAVPSSTSPGKIVIPSPKGNDSLAAAVNADIATLIQDGTVSKALESNGMDPALAGDGVSG